MRYCQRRAPTTRRLYPFRGGADARRGRACAGRGRCQRGRRLRLSQSEVAGLRFVRPRRRRPAATGRARCLRLYRARRLSQRRDRGGDRIVARRARTGGGKRAADACHGAAGRRRVPPRAHCRSGPWRPQLERASCWFRRNRHLARACLHRSQAPADRRNLVHGRRLCARPHRIRAFLAGQNDRAQRAGASER